MVDARLPDGSRVNAIVPPLSLEGPVLSIRRFGVRLRAEDLISQQHDAAGVSHAAPRLRRGPHQHHGLRRHRLRQDDVA